MKFTHRLSFPDLHRLLASSAIIQGTGLAVTILIGIQLARYLGPERYGVYGVIMAVVSIATIAAQFGLPSLAVREAAAATSNHPHTSPAAVRRWFLFWGTAIGSVVAFGSAAAIFLWSPPWLAGRTTLLFFAATGTLLLSLTAIALGLYRGLGKNLWGQALDVLVRPLLVAMMLFAIHYLSEDVTVADALAVQIVASLIAVAFLISAVLRFRSASASDTTFSPERWKTGAVALFSTTMLIAINANYPLLVAGLFVSARDLGIFRVALAAAALVALPTSIANISTGPLIAKLHREGDRTALSNALAHTTLASFVATAAGLILLVVAGQPLISFLFGAEYVLAYAPLLILGVAQLIVSAFGVTGTYLNLTGKERLVVRAFAVAVPFGLIVTIPFAARLGIVGAALGNVVMVILWHWYVLVLNRRQVIAPLSLYAAWKHLKEQRPDGQMDEVND